MSKLYFLTAINDGNNSEDKGGGGAKNWMENIFKIEDGFNLRANLVI